MRLRTVLALLLIVSMTAMAFAAPRRAKPRGGAKRPPAPAKPVEVTLTGTIESILPTGGISIRAGKGARDKNPKLWTVSADPSTTVTIVGTATLDYLRAGRLVEFNGNLAGNKLTAPVKELTVVTKVAHAGPGKKAPSQGHAVNTGMGRIEVPKDEGTDLDAEVAGSTRAAKPVDGSAPAAGVAGTGTKVAGKIVSLVDRKFTVASGGRTIEGELDTVPTINVLLTDPKDAKLVQVGSKIVVNGIGVTSKTESKVLAKTVRVTLAEPLSGKKPVGGTKAAAHK